ncbi:hypothetical protein LJC60_09690 [Ruminococcaceae bacterium OttesenSCG-928-D13]|nr:hypothetical protein [Ruminococcaceae bacterium OttesenSCG-928-D13]
MMPEQNAVLAIMSETMQMQDMLDAVWDVLLPRLGKMTLPTENDISDRTYSMDENALGIQQVHFDFGKDTIEITFDGTNGQSTLESGRGSWHASETVMPLGFRAIVPLFAQAKQPKRISAWSCWLNPNTLEINWVYRDTPHRDKLVCTFTKNTTEILCPPSDAALFKKQDGMRLRGTIKTGT